MPKKSKGKAKKKKLSANTEEEGTVNIHTDEPISGAGHTSDAEGTSGADAGTSAAGGGMGATGHAGAKEDAKSILSPAEAKTSSTVSVESGKPAVDLKTEGSGATDFKLQDYVVGPLTPEEQKEVRAAKAAYASFWQNLKFKKGWDTPLFFQSEIDDLLEQAAEIVGRIRVHLDTLHPDFKMRMIEGNAHEFFWSQHEHPRTHSEAFVRELVHQTLKDANGYVEGLTKEVVDSYIDKILAYIRDEDSSAVLRREVQLLKAKAQRQWKGLGSQWNDAFERTLPAVEDPGCTIVQLAALRELTRALDRVQYYVSIVQEEQAKQRQAQSRSEQATADAKERFAEQSAKRQQLKAGLHSQMSPPPGSRSVQSPVEANQASEGPMALAPDDTSGDTSASQPEAPGSPAKAPSLASPSQTPSQALGSPSMQGLGSPHRISTQGLASPSRVPSRGLASPTRTLSQDLLPTTRASSQEEEDPEDPPALKKIEELVKEVNVRKNELDRMKDRTQSLEIQELASRPLESHKTVKSLHERCKYLSLELERDLLKLDAIVGGSKVRPLRKAQVRNIQHMLEDVDSINEKLSGLETSLLPAVEEEQQKLAEQKAQEEAEAQRLRQEEEERKREEQRKLEEQERELEAQREREREQQRVSLVERWKQMKLQPKFDVQELRNGYQISAYIPGMRKEDLEITHSGNTLTLSGLRLPSREEEVSMGQLLQARGLAVDDQNLLRLGAGRFGRFQQQYSLPADVDTSGVKATYEAGVFQVTIPRKSRPQRGYPGGGGFFNDRDFWW